MTEEERSHLVRLLREQAKTCRGLALLQKNKIGAIRFEMKAMMAADFATVLEEIDCKRLPVHSALARRLKKRD